MRIMCTLISTFDHISLDNAGVHISVSYFSKFFEPSFRMKLAESTNIHRTKTVVSSNFTMITTLFPSKSLSFVLWFCFAYVYASRHDYKFQKHFQP